jgi:hypothetical protein
VDGDEGVELVVGAVIPPDDVIVTEGTSTFSGMDVDGEVRFCDRVDSYFDPFLAKAVRALFWFLLPWSSSSRNLFLSLVSSLSLHDGLRSCRSVESPVRLAFDAIEEVEPEVTAAAAAAIEVDVGKAVMEEAAEDDPLEGC